jgi:hypothetical protein
MSLTFTRTPGGLYIARTGTRDYKIGRINSRTWQLTIYAGTTLNSVNIAHQLNDVSTKGRAVAIANAFEQLGDDYQPAADRLNEALRTDRTETGDQPADPDAEPEPEMLYVTVTTRATGELAASFGPFPAEQANEIADSAVYDPDEQDVRVTPYSSTREGVRRIKAMRADQERYEAEAAELAAPSLTERPSAYEVCALPVGHRLFYRFVITVRLQGSDRWSVRLGRTTDGPALSRDGQWDYEQGHDLDDDWLGEHRYTLDEALAMAKVHAPLVQAQGYTVEQVLAAS